MANEMPAHLVEGENAMVYEDEGEPLSVEARLAALELTTGRLVMETARLYGRFNELVDRSTILIDRIQAEGMAGFLRDMVGSSKRRKRGSDGEADRA